MVIMKTRRKGDCFVLTFCVFHRGLLQSDGCLVIYSYTAFVNAAVKVHVMAFVNLTVESLEERFAKILFLWHHAII